MNCWIRDSPFKLDTLKDVPRLMEENSYCVTMDDKSGYQHILVCGRAKTYFGLTFGGWVLQCNVMTDGALLVEETYRPFGDMIQFLAAK